MPATHQEIKTWVSEISYKKDWTFETFDSSHLGALFFLKMNNLALDVTVNKISADMPDPRGHGNDIAPVEGSMVVPGWVESKEQFDTWFFAGLMTVEVHEAAEWYRHGGELVFDPHRRENLMVLEDKVRECLTDGRTISAFGYPETELV